MTNLTNWRRSFRLSKRNLGPPLSKYTQELPNEGLTLEPSVIETLYGSQFKLSTQLITPNYTVYSLNFRALLKICSCSSSFSFFLVFYSRLELVPPLKKDGTPQNRTPSRFAMFVKENYARIKSGHETFSHQDVMKALSTEFSKLGTQHVREHGNYLQKIKTFASGLVSCDISGISVAYRSLIIQPAICKKW